MRARYLGWLRRPQLWKTFTEHDLLVMPSTTLEAMGLVTLGAQACGLPVLYQPVPGLLPALRQSGYTNAARYPLSATAKALDDLGRQLT